MHRFDWEPLRDKGLLDLWEWAVESRSEFDTERAWELKWEFPNLNDEDDCGEEEHYK